MTEQAAEQAAIHDLVDRIKSEADMASRQGRYFILHKIASDVEEAVARAWDEGHREYPLLGPDDCECNAYNASECGCGLYGSNVITPNPYRTRPGKETPDA